jgi:peptidoglycan/LPS O-acetylase OafA/YrhL
MRSGGRVPEVDLVRVVTFGAVVGVHAVSLSFAALDVGGNAALMLLHYTRSGFFVLMAIVLVRSAERSGHTGRLRRRLTLVGVPYLVWSIIYLVVSWATGGRNRPWDGAGLALLTGTAWYHLYFLLVTMQFYVAFPAFLWLLRRTRRHPLPQLGTGLAFAVVFTGWLHYTDWAPGPLATYRAYAAQLLPTYTLLFVAGGVAALHLDAVLDWLTQHRRAVLAGTLAGAVGMEALYFVLVATGAHADAAADPVQPVMQVWAVVLVAALGAAATRWTAAGAPANAAMSNPTPHLRWVDRASDLSFGVYLVHPLLLLGLFAIPWMSSPPAAVTAVVATALAIGGSVVVAEIARRTPVSLALTGRPRRRPATAAARQVRPGPPLEGVR